MSEPQWVPVPPPGGEGYSLALVGGKVAARNAQGKVLQSLPKALKEHPMVAQLQELGPYLEEHERRCQRSAESWMLRAHPLPRAVVEAIWVDPAWRRVLQEAVVEVEGVPGALLLRAVGPRGFGAVDLEGESWWWGAPSLTLLHPVLIPELLEWRDLVSAQGIQQQLPQLHRPVFPRPERVDPTASEWSRWSGVEFSALSSALSAANNLGFRVVAGLARCRVWEAGALVEARMYLGEGDPMYSTETGPLYWVDRQERVLPLAEVGPVAWSEGCAMAQGIASRGGTSEGESDE